MSYCIVIYNYCFYNGRWYHYGRNIVTNKSLITYKKSDIKKYFGRQK